MSWHAPVGQRCHAAPQHVRYSRYPGPLSGCFGFRAYLLHTARELWKKISVTWLQAQSQLVFWKWQSPDGSLEERGTEISGSDWNHRRCSVKEKASWRRCNSVETDQGKAIRIRLGLKQTPSNGDERAAGLISSFRSSKWKERVHQQTPCWTSTIKGGSAEPADKNVNPSAEANQASLLLPTSRRLSTAAETRLPWRLATGQQKALNLCLSVGKKSWLVTSSPLWAFQERHWQTQVSLQMKIAHSFSEQKLVSWKEMQVHALLDGIGHRSILAVRPELLTHTTWRKLSN